MSVTIIGPENLGELTEKNVPLWLAGLKKLFAGEKPDELAQAASGLLFYILYVVLRRGTVSIAADEPYREHAKVACAAVLGVIDEELAKPSAQGFGDRLRAIVKIREIFQQLLAWLDESDVDWMAIIALIQQLAGVFA